MLASSCSSSHEVRFRVQLAQDVEIPPKANVAFVVQTYGAQGEGDIATEGWSGRVQVPANQGMRTYQGKASECCAPSPVVSLHAFIDFDGDRTLDPDEPRGSDPAGKVTLGETEYRAQIVITRATE